MELALLIFIAAISIQLLYYGFFLYQWNQNRVERAAQPFPVSVIICARNAAGQLEKNLPAVLHQDFPEFEVIVVNDGSEDHTAEVLSALQRQYPHLKTLYISPAEKKGSGKKYALQKGVQAAAHENILLTDADCTPASPQWIRIMTAGLRDKKIVLGISPLIAAKGFYQGLAAYETTQTALQYISYANAGMPYMGVGRNMCFQKTLFLQKKWTDAEMQLPSGDDDLFIQSMADRYNTATCINSDAYTYSPAPETPQAWFIQKKRHLATGYQYDTTHRVMLGIFLITKLLVYAGFLGSLFTGTGFITAFIFLFGYWCALAIINNHIDELYKLNSRWFLAPVFDIAYVFSIIFTGIAARTAPQTTWK